MTMPLNSRAGEDPQAMLSFLPNWEQHQYGKIKGGTKLVVEYSRERIQEWPKHGGVYSPRDWWHYAHFRFHPSGAYRKEPLFYPDPPAQPSYQPVAVTIPAGTTQLEIWFEHILYHFEPRRQPYVYWDSRYGDNYWFAVAD